MAHLVDIGASFVKFENGTRVPVTPDTTVAEFRDIIRAHVPDGQDMILSCQMHGFVLFDAETDAQVGDFVSWQRQLGDSHALPDDFTTRTGLPRKPTLPICKLPPCKQRLHVRSLSEAILTRRAGLTHETMACGMGFFNISTRQYERVPENYTLDMPVWGLGHPVLGWLDGRRVLTALGDMLCAYYGADHADCINIGTGSQVMAATARAGLDEQRPTVTGGRIFCKTQIPAGRVLATKGISWDALDAASTPEARKAIAELCAQYQPYLVDGTVLTGGLARRLASVGEMLGARVLHDVDEVMAGLARVRVILCTPFRINDSFFKIVKDSAVIQAHPEPYYVTFGPVERCLPGRFVLCDRQLAARYGLRADVPLDATEQEKTLETGVARVLDAFVARRITKADTVVAVGGGIVQDVSGYAATIFKRGIRWVYVPTTLLAMCDSCIGGKVGINHQAVKNMVGLFANPSEVVIDTRFLQTLPQREILNGLGELVKFATLAGNHMMDYMCVNLQNHEALIQMGLAVKTAVIEADQFDLGERLALNLGHTFGHALESASDNRVSHGIAVAVGIEVERRAVRDHGQWPPSYFAVLERLLRASDLPAVDAGRLAAAMRHDKKNRGSSICFAVMTAPGHCEIVHPDSTDELIGSLVAAYDAVRMQYLSL